MVLEVVAGYFFLGKEIAKYSNVYRFCEDHHDKWASTTEQLVCRVDQSNATRGAPGGWPSMDLLPTGGAGCESLKSGFSSGTGPARGCGKRTLRHMGLLHSVVRARTAAHF